MSEQNTLQYAREEADYLRKRAWDLLDRLDKLESQFNTSGDEDERHSFQIHISNTRRLLEIYKSEYEAMCREAGIPTEIIGTGISDDDFSPSRNIKNDQSIDLPPLFLMPSSRNPKFLGREDNKEVRDFIQRVLKLQGKPFIYGFKGMGGVGKTEIAKELCYIFHDTWEKQPNLPENLTDLLSQRKGGFFRDGILWIQFHPEGQTPKTLIDKLIDFLIEQCPKVDISKKIKEIQEIDNLKDANLDTLTYMLSGKDMLVVLDNVEQNMRTLDYVLERFKGRFTLLITSRIAIPGIKSINLDVLTEEDAEKLFLSYMKKDNQQPTEEERKIVQELCKLLGNYPLLIKIIASQAKTDNSKLAELLKKYKENPVQLLDECNDSLCIDQRHVNVRTCFMMSFNSLDEEQQRVFGHAALFNNPFTVENLSVLLKIDEKEEKLKELGYIVNRLERLSLVNRLAGKDGQENAYELHPLMRKFALDSLMQSVTTKIADRKEEMKTRLKDLQQWKKDNILQEKLKNDRSLLKEAIDAMQYCDQVFDFDLVLSFAHVLNGLICLNEYERLRLNRLTKRAVVARQQNINEKHYRKLCADMEEKPDMFKNKFDFVGRRKNLTHFEDEFLFQPKSFILNIHTDGNGGIGKTQLLQQMLKLCRSKYFDTVISCDELIDFYYTEARSKAGSIEQIIGKLGIDHFPRVDLQLERYRRTKDSSERQYILDDTVMALRKDYAVFAALSERAEKIVILFFDTYEVIQFVNKEKNTVEGSDYSEWLEKELFPALQTDNTRLVIAGRYPLINAAEDSVVTQELSLFEENEAIDFLLEYLKVAEFSTDEYQAFLRQFPHAESLLQEFQSSLEAERIGVRMYEFPNGYRKELGEEVWQVLQNRVPVKQEKELLDALQLTHDELMTVIELAGSRPIYLALFMDWIRFSKGEPGKLVREVQNIDEEEAKRELFENTILEWLWKDKSKRKYIYYMTVAYRRMTAEIMQHLTGDSPEQCKKMLEDIRHFSFTKYKKDKKKGDIVLLHDEMRDLIIKRWRDRINSDQKKILNKLIDYYKEKLLSPDYHLTDISYSRLEQQKVPKHIIDTIKNITSSFSTKKSFDSALREQDGLTQAELDSYLLEIIKAATQEVSQEKQEAYFPELNEYDFMVDAENGAQKFYEEFEIAMDDGRPAYAGLLRSEAVRCHRKYGASPLHALEIELRGVQRYIDSDKPEDINKALEIIESLNKQQENKASWKDSLLFGKFILWKGIAKFWQEDKCDKDKDIDSLKEAWRIFISYDEQEDLVYLADNWIGYVYYRKSDFVEAENWMKISLEGLIDLLSKDLHNKKRRKRNLQQRIQYALGNLAILYRYTGNFIEAIRYAEIQLNIVQSLPRNKKEILRSLNTLGHVLAIAGRNIDARFYLEKAKKIYKEIPDRLLGGRVYSNFCQLSYGIMEFAHLIEYYRAEDLHKAVENSSGTHVQKYIDYAEKAIYFLEKEPVFHKELADASFSLGELYMMMPASHPAIQRKGDKWELAKQAFEKALESAKNSKFQYTVIDTLESLVTLYYFQSHTGQKISPECKARCADKQKEYQKEIENDWNIKQYPNLAGRYELIQGDIYFDKALELLKEEYQKVDSALGIKHLIKAFDHYAASADYKKQFNINRYYIMLRVIYNRLDKLIELTHPLTFPRLESLDYEQEERFRDNNLISRSIFSQLKKNQAAWENKVENFSKILNYAYLLGKKKIEANTLQTLEGKLAKHKKEGAYWEAVLVNKCLTELYWIQANIHLNNKNTEEAEKHLEQVVLHLNRHSRQYRLMGDSFHAKRSYKRAEKIITTRITSNFRLKKGLEGYTAIVKGEYYLHRVEFATLLESLVAGELKVGQKKFEDQYSEEKNGTKVSALDKSKDFFKEGIKLLEESLKDACWENQPLHELEQYQNKLSEAYFMLGELFILREKFSDALRCFEKCMETCPVKEKDCRIDDAKQSYLSALYFSDDYDKQEYHEKIREYTEYLKRKIQDNDYSRPWVAARFRITQGDILFSKYYCMKEKLGSNDDSSPYKFKDGRTVERKDLVKMFREYIEACNYKASYNELSFEAGLRVLRRRIEMIPDSESLDILPDIFRQLWQDGESLRKKKEELDSILQFIRMRSLVLQYKQQ